MIYQLFKNIVSPFVGKGFGKYKILSWPYQALAKQLLPNSSKVVDLGEYKLKVPLRKGENLDGVAQQLIFKNTYEPGTTKIIRNLVKRGMGVIDVGANIGYFTYLMSKLVGENGRVYAFEPEPDNYYALTENWVLNKAHNVDLSNLAISNSNGYAYLYISSKESGEHSLEALARQYSGKVRINTVKLDYYLPLAVGLIKIDVEGHEIKVIEGARELLLSPDNINTNLIVEFWLEGLMKIDPSEPYRLFPILNSYGYKYIYIIRESDGKLIHTDIRGLLQYCDKLGFSTNLLCSRSSYGES